MCNASSNRACLAQDKVAYTACSVDGRKSHANAAKTALTSTSTSTLPVPALEREAGRQGGMEGGRQRRREKGSEGGRGGGREGEREGWREGGSTSVNIDENF